MDWDQGNNEIECEEMNISPSTSREISVGRRNEKTKQPAIGIDLGTTYSCVGVWENGRVEIITNDLGNRTTPSWVAFTQTHRLIGKAAKNQAAMNPSNTIFDAKRLIGRNFDDPIVQDDMKHWPFKVIADPNDTTNGTNSPVFVVNYKDEEKLFFPEQISAMILEKMKEIAENYLGKKVKNAVVTVPAYFNDAQRKATKDAGVIAGLNVLRIINEPTAAAIAYGLDKELIGYNNGVKRNILVFDLGGGTFDVSIVTVRKDVFEVIAVTGDTHLGGGDFDRRLVVYLVAEFERKYNKKLGDNPRALARLTTSCERAKRSLSSTTNASIEIDCLFDGIDFCTTITRARFESLNIDLFDNCLELVVKCLEDAKMSKSNVHDIVLVGGSTRIPRVQQMLRDYFNGKELCRRINPDEAVAYGAASHAAILAGVGDHKDIVLFDVTPLSLGIEVYDTSMLVVVPRNTIIPIKMYARNLETPYDNLVAAIFRIYEGERFKAKDNTFLGEFILHDIPPRPKGASLFDVCFEMDANGILTVSAHLVGTYNMNQVTITEHNERLKKYAIDRMVKEGEIYKAQDEEFKKAMEAKTALESFIEEVRLKVRQCPDTISEDKKRLVEDAIERTMGCLDWNHQCGDVSLFEQKKAELLSVSDHVFVEEIPKIEVDDESDDLDSFHSLEDDEFDDLDSFHSLEDDDLESVNSLF
ncbi:heat shock 70 kDa protein 18-like [Silene latifolia]|uniref:heat shock 70 kDa protein 18-like n=1 Tax=Silene latifolia TaxID=37657 RepID=UPI003D77D6FC